MIGMDRTTGTASGGEAHLRQSVGDILTTPIGARVMRRDYGSRLFELIDAPLNAATRLLLFAATAGALARWEPRLLVDRIQLAAGADGRAQLTITGRRRDADGPVPLSLAVPLG